jgi:hypothetical protein
MAVHYDLFPMFGKAQILSVAILLSGTLFAEISLRQLESEAGGFKPLNGE